MTADKINQRMNERINVCNDILKLSPLNLIEEVLGKLLT